ncbi:hypothetical protein GBAG_3377 [Buttiauxella agrestis ATCC 33320]|uniref:Uncharacterized protein n=1 Tax=Buttiauxella agrestis ATCC 33320 TaxID=1006004 RepID=A0A085G3N4_9ENTR|nr:hypothetical protein GBAG_3377 [Buttiauxella agrestis ATCC 33320]
MYPHPYPTLKLTARQVETAKPKEKLPAIGVYPDVSLAEA